MQEYLNDFHFREILVSLAFLAALALLRFLLIRLTMRGSEVLSKDQRRWIVRVKNFVIALGIIGLFTIWAPQIQTFALSLAAVAVAVVVALKEVILGFTASFVRVSTTPFRVGDWIVIDGQAGEVIDIDAFTLRMQEVDLAGGSYEYTGRMFVVPNGKIFTSSIVNLGFTKGHIFKDVSVTAAWNDADPAKTFQTFEAVVAEIYAPYEKAMGEVLRRTTRKTALKLAPARPAISIRTTDFGHYVMTARMFLPVEDVMKVSTEITRRTVQAAYVSRKAGKEEAEEKDESEKENETERK